MSANWTYPTFNHRSVPVEMLELPDGSLSLWACEDKITAGRLKSWAEKNWPGRHAEIRDVGAGVCVVVEPKEALR